MVGRRWPTVLVKLFILKQMRSRREKLSKYFRLQSHDESSVKSDSLLLWDVEEALKSLLRKTFFFSFGVFHPVAERRPIPDTSF